MNETVTTKVKDVAERDVVYIAGCSCTVTDVDIDGEKTHIIVKLNMANPVGPTWIQFTLPSNLHISVEPRDKPKREEEWVLTPIAAIVKGDRIKWDYKGTVHIMNVVRNEPASVWGWHLDGYLEDSKDPRVRCWSAAPTLSVLRDEKNSQIEAVPTRIEPREIIDPEKVFSVPALGKGFERLETTAVIPIKDVAPGSVVGWVNSKGEEIIMKTYQEEERAFELVWGMVLVWGIAYDSDGNMLENDFGWTFYSETPVHVLNVG